MSTNIYDMHNAAFKQVSAYVVCKEYTNGKYERIASVAFKHPKDGAGRLYCYLHVIGTPMVRASANGYGYDKKSAAISAAVAKLHVDTSYEDCRRYNEAALELQNALSKETGSDWVRELEKRGLKVLQAV